MTNFENLFTTASKISENIFFENYKPTKGFGTTVAHAGHNPLDLPDLGRPVIPPITLSSTFQQIEPGVGKYDYSRSGNYSRHSLEICLTKIHNGSSGFAFASGLAAVGAITQLLSSGDHVICFDDLYGGTGRYFRKISTKNGIIFDFVDMRSHEILKQKLQPNTKLVFIETPSNPLMRLVDISKVSEIVHQYNREIIVVVDNTFMTPYFQTPLNLGADIVLESLTKYINGHSDVVMGSLVVNKARSELAKQLAFIQFAAGAVPSAFDCFLCLRGIRTLALRMQAHMKAALTIATFLESLPQVESVIHPGLKSHPQHDLALKQMKGYSGMVTVYLKCTPEQTIEFVKSLKLFCLAESLGGFESLIEIPLIMTHASVPAELRAELGITGNMLRISVGIEDCRDLAEDLYLALEKLK